MLDSPLDENGNLRGVLLSIHLTSNRPDNFVKFLDRLQEKTDDLSSVEVAVKIDEDNEEMNKILARESRQRPFKITYISTPLSGGFYGLWQAYDEILRACDPYAYFVIGLNDETHFKTKAWDTVLRKYVGLFPDHIFRLRTSVHRSRNYYDFWEAGFANDTSAIMTRRWVELGGGWCPCNGPDTFQQYVAFYFGWLDRFNANRIYREFAIYDIEFSGHGANSGLSGRALNRRMGGGIRPWFILVSYQMQEEAARRAQKLHAHIWAHQQGIQGYEVRDNPRRRRIEVVDPGSGRALHHLGYRLNSARIWITNTIRTLNYLYYGGGGDSVGDWLTCSITHLRWRYAPFDWFLEEYFEAYAPKPSGRLRAYYFRRGLIRTVLVWPIRGIRLIGIVFVWPKRKWSMRGIQIIAYQIELLRQIYRDPDGPSPIRKVWKYNLYRRLVLVFAIWPRQALEKAQRLF